MTTLDYTADGTSVRCTCCSHSKKIAEIHGTAIELPVRSGGTRGYHLVGIRTLLEHMAGTVTYQGITDYLKGIYK